MKNNRPLVSSCNRCHQEKSLEDFSRKKDNASGHRHICKECSNIQRREYYAIHRKESSEYQMRIRRENPAKYYASSRKRGKKFQQTPKGHYHNLKQNSRKRNMGFSLTQEEFVEWYADQKRECYYCEKPQSNVRLSVDRKDNARPYELTNMTLACRECNSVKSNILTEQEMLIIGQVVMKKRWKTQI